VWNFFENVPEALLLLYLMKNWNKLEQNVKNFEQNLVAGSKIQYLSDSDWMF